MYIYPFVRLQKRSFTFSNKSTVRAHEIQPPIMFEIDGFVFGELVDTQMFDHAVELLFAWMFAEEAGNLLNFTSQVLLGRQSISQEQMNYLSLVYPFEVLVKDEEKIGMVSLGPGVQQVWKVRRTVN